MVIPTYNRAEMVVEAVQCVLAQTHSNTEIIVVDDGGTDDTPQRLAEFGPRVLYLRQANQGVAAARNAGIRRASGEFVAFLDSDDLWHQRKLEIQMDYLRRHPEVGIVVCHWDLRPGRLALRPAAGRREPDRCRADVLRALGRARVFRHQRRARPQVVPGRRRAV